MQKWRPRIMVDLHFMPRSGSHFSRRRSCFHDYKWSSFTFRIVGKMVFVIEVSEESTKLRLGVCKVLKFSGRFFCRYLGISSNKLQCHYYNRVQRVLAECAWRDQKKNWVWQNRTVCGLWDYIMPRCRQIALERGLEMCYANKPNLCWSEIRVRWNCVRQGATVQYIRVPFPNFYSFLLANLVSF